MPALPELREKAKTYRDQILKQRDEFNARKAAGKTGDELWPDETRKTWDKINADYDATMRSLKEEEDAAAVAKRAAEVEAAARERREGVDEQRGPLHDAEGREFRSAAEAEATRDLAFQAWAGRSISRNRSERHLQAAQRFGIDPSRNEISLDLGDTRQIRSIQSAFGRMHPANVEPRALSSLLGSAGGYTVASSLMNALEVNMLAVGGLLQVADTITTGNGEEMSWPTADDTGNEGEMLGENAETDDDEEPTFAAVKFSAYDFSSKIVRVPNNLLDDSAFNLAAELGRMLGERVGRSLNRKCTSGTGASQPKGIVTCATLGVTAASSTAITADEVIRLQHSVDPSYRTNAGWSCHDSVVLALRLLKDGLGAYLWRSGLQDNRPDALLGQPVTLNQNMDSTLAAANKVLLYGDHKKYKVRRVSKVLVRRLEERYAEYNQVGFVTIIRADGNLLDAGTAPIKYLKMKP